MIRRYVGWGRIDLHPFGRALIHRRSRFLFEGADLDSILEKRICEKVERFVGLTAAARGLLSQLPG